MEPDQSLFEYSHLPEHLQSVSARFGELAFDIYRRLPPSTERAVCLRKLLEAKDAGVRAVLTRKSADAPTHPELVLRTIAAEPGLNTGEIATALSMQGHPMTEMEVWFALGYLVTEGSVGALVENDAPVWMPRDPERGAHG